MREETLKEEACMRDARISWSRRDVLRGLGAISVSAVAGAGVLGRPGAAAAQGNLAALGPEEKVEATMARLFGNRPIKEDTKAIKVDLPLIAENGAVVPITVEVESPMTPASHVKSIYVISDKNRRPMNAKFVLTPAAGMAWVGANLRLGESTDVRVVAELSDGTLIGSKRHVKVTVGGCGG
jgi:sulfur-oxidizing protein SoxY